MGRAPCCDKMGVKRGPWTAQEDHVLVSYIQTYGHGNWRALPKKAGLNRCGKSCRLRWTNYLRPDIKRGNFTKEEEDTIIRLHAQLGNRWSAIAAKLPGRTDNEIKNVWHTSLKKHLPPDYSKAETPVVRWPNEAESSPEEQPVSVPTAKLTLKRQKQQLSPLNELLWSVPSGEDEPATSCSSDSVSAISQNNDELVDFSSFEVTELDDAFWKEAFAMEVATPAEDRPTECAPCSSGASDTTTCSWPELTSYTCGGSTTCRQPEALFQDGADFWFKIFDEAGNLPL